MTCPILNIPNLLLLVLSKAAPGNFPGDKNYLLAYTEIEINFFRC
jgi:hypothetical protein